MRFRLQGWDACMRAALSFVGVRRRTVLAAAFMAVTGALAWMTAPRAPGAPLPAPATAVIARHFIAAGNVIAPADVAEKNVTGVSLGGAPISAQAVIGRVSDKDIRPGSVVGNSDLRDPVSLGIAGRLAAGQRAFSIRVAEDDIVGGFLQSGDHIDIFATLPGSVFPAKGAEDQLDRSRVLLLLQDISVLAVGENLNTAGAVQPGARTVSVALSPPQLARLTLALRLGRVSMAIRKPGDDAPSATATATLRDILPNPGAPEGPAPRGVARSRTAVPFYAGSAKVAMVEGYAP
jgi:pilus assembly protein CpaB